MANNLLALRAELLAELGEDPVRYDLGCGQRPEDGFVGIDLHSPTEGVLRVDLYQYPWPIETESVDYFRASHFLEHVPDWDAHFTEVYRCLKPGGYYEIIAPYFKNDRWFQDPDHKQAILHQRFAYLRRDWLLANKIEHGRAVVNFSPVQWFELLNDDFKDQGFDAAFIEWHKSHSWNVIEDLAVILRKEPL
jgi:SAM-dependent methyltransferase